jgi:hypothetical protein
MATTIDEAEALAQNLLAQSRVRDVAGLLETHALTGQTRR